MQTTARKKVPLFGLLYASMGSCCEALHDCENVRPLMTWRLVGSAFT